ncbi:PIR Superfamily Protein, partial [Plasmodium malariae]
MTSRYTKENETSVTLLLKYRKEFDEAIANIKNEKRGELDENPIRKCASIDDGDFIQPRQEIGRYLIEIKINSDEKYNKNSDFFQKYKEFSSRTDNLCIAEIKKIDRDTLTKFTDLYDLYEEFDNFNGSNVLSNSISCNPIKKCYNFYNNKYRE